MRQSADQCTIVWQITYQLHCSTEECCTCVSTTRRPTAHSRRRCTDWNLSAKNAGGRQLHESAEFVMTLATGSHQRYERDNLEGSLHCAGKPLAYCSVSCRQATTAVNERTRDPATSKITIVLIGTHECRARSLLLTIHVCCILQTSYIQQSLCHDVNQRCYPLFQN